MAREALGIAGAVIGFAVTGGNPLGAQIGFAVGSAVGAYIDPTKIPGPSLGEAPIQTSRDGIPIPIIYGTHHTHGNIIQTTPVVEVTTTERQGKGGSTKVEETRRYRTFAIGVCRGPIDSISRIWENDRLVYDSRSSPALPAAETTAYAANIRIYTGSADQLPDADLEADTGVGECPAYRGLAYIVWVNYDITDFGSAIPQYRFEVNGGATDSAASKPYPIELVEGMAATIVPDDDIYQVNNTEGLDSTIDPQNGTLAVKYHSYDYEEEGLDSTIVPQAGTLAVKYHTYDYEEEGLDATIAPQNGTLTVQLIAYDYEVEGLDSTITPSDGTLV